MRSACRSTPILARIALSCVRSVVIRTPDSAATDGVGDHENDDRAADGDQHAVEIEAVDALAAERRHDPAAHHGPDDAEDDVEHDAFAVTVDEFAGNETGDQAEDDPRND